MFVVIQDIGTEYESAVVKLPDLGAAILFAERLAEDPLWTSHTLEVRREVGTRDIME